MKQRITVEQFQELEVMPEARAKLKAWYDTKQFSCPLLTIGQLIEFLDEKLGSDEWVRKLFAIEGYMDHSGRQWLARNPHVFPYNSELCDALWESVKEVLERE